jgi:ELWxxDGT repeat protein
MLFCQINTKIMHTKSILLLLLASTALAQTPTLVKDINSGIFGGIQTTSNAAVVGNTLYFNAVGTKLDEELWKTEDTAASTVLVKDINAGNQGSQQKFFSVYKDQLVSHSKTLGLGSEPGLTDETKLRVSNGVAAGIHLLKDSNSRCFSAIFTTG